MESRQTELLTADQLIKMLLVKPFYVEEGMRIPIVTGDVHRPGLQLAGFFDYFANERLQVIGRVEMSYLAIMEPDARRLALERFFAHDFPALILCRDYEPLPDMLELARTHHRPLFGSSWSTTRFMHHAIGTLDELTAPRVSLHGVLMDVHGVGVMITGESGIGKSETSLELVKRGHRLVADDVVDILAMADGRLMGSCPEMIRHFMEIRGVGIIDVKSLYGTGAVLARRSIDLVIHLELWDEDKQYERLGMDQKTTDILGIKVPELVPPVRQGRNLAIIMEVAARNFRQQRMGYSAAEEIERRVKEEPFINE